MSFILFLLSVSNNAYASEALNYAKHGCEIESSEKGCKAYERLKKLHSNSRDTDTESSTLFKTQVKDSRGNAVNLNVNIDNSIMESLVSNCQEYKIKIMSCSPYSCSIKDPFGGITEFEIVGKEKDLCIVKEVKQDVKRVVCKLKKEHLSVSGKMVDSKFMRFQEYLEKWYDEKVCILSDY